MPGGQPPATAVWIPLSLLPDPPVRGLSKKVRTNVSPIWQQGNRDPERKSDWSKVAQGGKFRNPSLQVPRPGSPPLPPPSSFLHRGTALRLGSWATQSGPLWAHSETTGRKRGLLVSPVPARAPAALWAAGRAPPPGPLVSAGPRHQPPQPACGQSSNPEPHFHQRAGSGCARGRPTVRMRLSAVSLAAGASFGVAVGPEPLEGAGLGAPWSRPATSAGGQTLVGGLDGWSTSFLFFSFFKGGGAEQGKW